MMEWVVFIVVVLAIVGFFRLVEPTGPDKIRIVKTGEGKYAVEKYSYDWGDWNRIDQYETLQEAEYNIEKLALTLRPDTVVKEWRL